MSAKLSRSGLLPEVAYYDLSCEQYFWSPDGDGVFWYETKAELEEQHGPARLVRYVTELLDY